MTDYVYKKHISTPMKWKKLTDTHSYILAEFLTKTERQEKRTRTPELRLQEELTALNARDGGRGPGTRGDEHDA